MTSAIRARRRPLTMLLADGMQSGACAFAPARRNGVVSADGNWLAYESDSRGEPGHMDVYGWRYPV